MLLSFISLGSPFS